MTTTMHSHPTRRDVPCINAMQMSLHAILCLHVRYMPHATYLLHYMSSVMDKLHLIHIIISIFITHISHKTSNMQFPAQAIRNLKHFRYKSIPKTEVSKTKTDHSSTVRDPVQCSAHGLAENFILLNSRLNEIFIEFKNARIEVWTRKLWSSEIDAADSQGYAEIGAHPRLPFCSGFCRPGRQCSVSNSPETP